MPAAAPHSPASTCRPSHWGEADFLEFVRGECEKYKVPASRLCFEITETAAIANLDMARRLMNELRRDGARFALDDFGKGLSSFGYLRSLPVDYIKIDAQFVRDMTTDPIDLAMVRSINGGRPTHAQTHHRGRRGVP